jgi:protoporphyrin/coproporphyrin ferrochelatase
LRRITERQGELLSNILQLPVYVGMRNWSPYIPAAVRQMQADGVAGAIAICLAPHNSRTSVGLYKKALFAEDHGRLQIDFLDSWHDHPLLIRAFAERFQQTWPAACAEYGRAVPLIFTAHSVPTRTVEEGDPYEQQVRHTAELVAAASGLALTEWRFAFQSQGASGGPWLGPTVEDTMVEIKSTGQTGVFIQPIGFVCDHVEVLYDVDIAFRAFAAQSGMRLWRAESLNDLPTFIAALADLTMRALATRESKFGTTSSR